MVGQRRTFRSLKKTLNGITSSYTRRLIKKNYMKGLCKRSFENKLCGILCTFIKGSSLLL